MRKLFTIFTTAIFTILPFIVVGTSSALATPGLSGLSLKATNAHKFIAANTKKTPGVITPPCLDQPISKNIKTGALSDHVKPVRCNVPPGGLPRITPLPVTDPPTDPNPTPDPSDPTAPSNPGTPSDPGTPTPTDPVADPGTDPTPQPPQPPFVDPGFRYFPPGVLTSQDAGRGRVDRKVWLPDMIYPLKLGDNEHPHMNSQIWGYGGGGWNRKGAAGGRECDQRNYDPMKQRENFCEVRGWSMPLCPAGKGHQGQDIRPPSCKDNKWDVVAVVDGKIDMRTRNTTVRLVGKDGTKYRYLHMHPNSIRVSVGQRVKQGDVLGRISRYMGGRKATSTHLHFDVKQTVKIGNRSSRSLYVPLYTSLIAAYRHSKGLDRGIDSNGDLIAQYPLEIGVPAPPPEPTPSDPTEPSEPTDPTDPAPTDPTPSEPTEPTDPAPTDPTPSEPTEPTDPAPTDPTPSEPTEPTPPDPTPSEPGPVEPPAGDRTWWQWGKDTVTSWTDWWNN